MTRADKVLIMAIALAALLSGPASIAFAGLGSSSSLIVDGPAGETVVPIGKDCRLEVAGLQGAVVVEIADGVASVSSADCPDHVCVRSGSISRPGSAIVCVPNGVSVRIGGERSDRLDAVAR